PYATLGVPRPCSAGELCKAMLAASVNPGSLDASGLDRTLRHDAERALLEVQAGVTWRSLERYVGADFLPGTVGESIAANHAGPDGRPMVEHLRALTLATGDGELRRASRERESELFRLAVGGFGALGPFYSLTLDLASLASSAARAAAPARIELPDSGGEGPRFAVELLVPPQCSDAVIGQVRAALQERRCSLSLLQARRVFPEAETLLRWARCEYAALGIEFRTRATLGAVASAAQLRGRLIDLAIGAGGSFMPQSLATATRAQAAVCYPMLSVFLAEKRRHDPAERVLTPWYRAVRRMWRTDACRVRWAKD
ncbi:MAG: FAD-dependent oxidoreductase, partial [Betaproteobacteria bacterium]|nr:FAD-dependent oxidoreductase [Betaproteobacteria bacterium]